MEQRFQLRKTKNGGSQILEDGKQISFELAVERLNELAAAAGTILAFAEDAARWRKLKEKSENGHCDNAAHWLHQAFWHYPAMDAAIDHEFYMERIENERKAREQGHQPEGPGRSEEGSV